MNILNRMEKKLGRFAIPNLSKWIVLIYIISYVIYYLSPATTVQFLLEPYAIIHMGQVWRLITWLLVPPTNTNIFFVLIMLFFYYSIGSSLEKTWGTFRFNFYIFSGIIYMLIGAFILYFVSGGTVGIGFYFSTHYINLAIFLAYAATYPDMTVLLYFIIPLKIKWLAYVDIAIILYDFIKSDNWAIRTSIIVSLLNFIIFFLASRSYRSGLTAEKIKKKKRRFFTGTSGTGFTSSTASSQRETSFKSAASGKITKHKCAICGRTENDGIELEFRFCSKCNGNYEYCQDHLFTHTHK